MSATKAVHGAFDAAKDAIVLDTTSLDAEAAFQAALAIVMGSSASRSAHPEERA